VLCCTVLLHLFLFVNTPPVGRARDAIPTGGLRACVRAATAEGFGIPVRAAVSDGCALLPMLLVMNFQLDGGIRSFPDARLAVVCACAVQLAG
jgi:hypothetical protein